MKKIILSVILALSSFILGAQWAYQYNKFYEGHVISYNEGIGGEVKGLYVGAGSIILTSTVFYLVMRDDIYDVTASNYITYSVGLLAPAGAIGMVFGAGLAKNHSQIHRSFQVGGGLVMAPVYLRTRTGKIEYFHHPGINIRIVSPEFNNWRYSFGFTHFVFDEHRYFNESTMTSASDIDLDLQYLFSVGESIKIYPFIGAKIHKNTIKKSSGLFRDSQKSTFASNFGLGTSIEFKNKMSVFGELKLSIDEHEHNRFISTIGATYYL